MILTLDLNPQESEWLSAWALQQGLQPAEILRQVEGSKIANIAE